jgi:hypothetical protein
MRMNRIVFLLALALASLLGACGRPILGVSVFGASAHADKVFAKAPSDVTAFVTVKDAGDPVSSLSADNFEIYENSVLLNQKEIGLRMLPRNSEARGHAIVLLDLSGPPDEKELKRINRGAAHFVEKVSTTQSVTVVAFDGSERAREVARFSRVETSTKRDLPDLAPFLSKDTSRDLHSALLSAIKGLTSSLQEQKGEVQFGTIVTLARGPDLAGRKTEKEVRSAIYGSGYEFYSISPEELKFDLLGTLGKDKSFTYPTVDTLPMRFQDLGMRVRAAWQSHYVISYCSPGRAGTRKLKIKVSYESESGAKRTATASSSFEATGFQAGCAPKDTESAESVSAPTQASENDEPEEDEESVDEPKEEDSKASDDTPRKKKKKKQKRADPADPDNTSDSKEGSTDGVVDPPPTGKYE